MKYFKVTFLLVVLFFSTGSCQNKKTNMNWELIDFNKIPGETLINNFFDALSKYHFEEILTISKDHFILIGDNSKDTHDDYTPKQVEGVVFVSLDGGKTFKKKVLGKGSIREAVILGDTIFLAIVNNGSSQLIKADTSFEKWEVINDFKEAELSKVNFYSPAVGLASFLTENAHQELKSEIKYTGDGGKTWENANIKVSGGFGSYLFVNADEISYIENNQLIKLNFKTGERVVLIPKIAPEGFKSNGTYFKDPVTGETYTYIENEASKESAVQNLKTLDITALPKGADHLAVFGSYFHTMVKDGTFYNYVWSDNKGKTWNTEEIREFFVMPSPVGYYGKGYVYAIVSCFKGPQEERGGRFAIRKPD